MNKPGRPGNCEVKSEAGAGGGCVAMVAGGFWLTVVFVRMGACAFWGVPFIDLVGV